MGTSYHITVAGIPNKFSNSDIQKMLDKRLATLNHRLSTYLSDSELSQLNDSPIGECITLSEDLWRVLQLSHQVGALTQGAFDITVGPLVNLWGFGPGEPVEHAPNAEMIKDKLAQVGFLDAAVLEDKKTCIVKQKPVSLDLSAIAKGYAVDELANIFNALQVNNYMIEIGGELRLSGNSPRGDSWRIAIEKPGNSLDAVQVVLTLSDQGLATSGDYRNYFEEDGQRFSHTIDPRTGYPVTHKLASVTVIANTAARADALATALSVMGPESGWQFANEHGLAVYFIIREGETFRVQYTTHFAPFLLTQSD